MSNLFLIPVPLNELANYDPSDALSDNNQLVPLFAGQGLLIKHLKHFVVETPKIARAWLKLLQLDNSLQSLHVYELNKHQHDLSAIIQVLLTGSDVGVMSDCGMPCIADPGSRLVALAHQYQPQIKIVPLIGPSSILLLLAASGLNGQNFAFNGYLPIVHEERLKALKRLEALITQQKQTQIFIETPFRAMQLFTFIIKHGAKNTKLSLAVALMTRQQAIITRSIADWAKHDVSSLLCKQQVIFALGN